MNVHHLPTYKKINRAYKTSPLTLTLKIPTKKGKFRKVQYPQFPEIKELRNHKSLIFVNSVKESSGLAKKLSNFSKKEFLPFNASQNPRQRIRNQNWFIEGKIQGLVCTDVAASGINLPAEIVYIPPSNYKNEPHPEFHFQQMIGKAGRPAHSTNAYFTPTVEYPKSLILKKLQNHLMITTYFYMLKINPYPVRCLRK